MGLLPCLVYLIYSQAKLIMFKLCNQKRYRYLLKIVPLTCQHKYVAITYNVIRMSISCQQWKSFIKAVKSTNIACRYYVSHGHFLLQPYRKQESLKLLIDRMAVFWTWLCYIRDTYFLLEIQSTEKITKQHHKNFRKSVPLPWFVNIYGVYILQCKNKK